jgi:hypothetical protein
VSVSEDVLDTDSDACRAARLFGWVGKRDTLRRPSNVVQLRPSRLDNSEREGDHDDGHRRGL